MFQVVLEGNFILVQLPIQSPKSIQCKTCIFCIVQHFGAQVKPFVERTSELQLILWFCKVCHLEINLRLLHEISLLNTSFCFYDEILRCLPFDDWTSRVLLIRQGLLARRLKVIRNLDTDHLVKAWGHLFVTLLHIELGHDNAHHVEVLLRFVRNRQFSVIWWQLIEEGKSAIWKFDFSGDVTVRLHDTLMLFYFWLQEHFGIVLLLLVFPR